jgi:hypothetical protein
MLHNHEVLAEGNRFPDTPWHKAHRAKPNTQIGEDYQTQWNLGKNGLRYFSRPGLVADCTTAL